MISKSFVTLLLMLVMKGDIMPVNVTELTSNLNTLVEYQEEGFVSFRDLLLTIQHIQLENKAKLERAKSHQTKPHPGDVVAFFARVKTKLTDLGLHQTVLFQDAITNIGGVYNPETSIFHCPFNGLYEFRVTIVTPWLKHTSTDLMAGNQLIMRILASATQHGGGSGSNYALLELKKGDVVYVRLNSPHNGGEITSDFISSFSGRLIHKY